MLYEGIQIKRVKGFKHLKVSRRTQSLKYITLFVNLLRDFYLASRQGQRKACSDQTHNGWDAQTMHIP